MQDSTKINQNHADSNGQEAVGVANAAAAEQPTRRVCLGMPGYGELHAGAARGFYRASRGLAADIPLAIDMAHRNGSLLAANFNMLWCWALNIEHRGEKVDYFAMLHSDVEPEDYWLDILIEEMEARDLDIIGTVIPIKDPKGLTSLALGRKDGDTWRPQCRLTMSEIFQLPETFTSEDLGGFQLLLNTGCWVCRFDSEWARKVFFSINDRIVFSTSGDCYAAEVEPEDWHFSRMLNELGLKIGATRKVRITHHGTGLWSNIQSWGSEEFDSQHVSESVIPLAGAPEGFVFPKDVDGWLKPLEGAALARLSEGKRVLEIGSYCGRSTICIAQAAKKVFSLDPHDGRGTAEPRNTREIFQRNLERYGVADKVESIDYTSEFRTKGEVVKEHRPDLVFIDGDHAYEAVRFDIARALVVMSPNGLLAFHDYRTNPREFDGGWDPGVTQAVDELLASGGELVERCGTVAVVRPPAQAFAPKNHEAEARTEGVEAEEVEAEEVAS